jgi:hypothetical protein
VLSVAAGDHGSDALLPDLGAVFVVVMATVSIDTAWPLPGRPRRPRTGPDGLDQWQKPDHIVTVGAGQGHCQRDAVRFGDQVLLGARPGTGDRARSRLGSSFSALIWELSITARD